MESGRLCAWCEFHSGSSPFGVPPTSRTSHRRDAHDPLFIGRCTGGVWEMLCFISNTPHTHTYTCTKICDGVHSWLWTGTNLNAVFRGLLVKSNTACSSVYVVGSATHKSCHFLRIGVSCFPSAFALVLREVRSPALTSVKIAVVLAVVVARIQFSFLLFPSRLLGCNHLASNEANV